MNSTKEMYKFIKDNYFNDYSTSGYRANGTTSYLHLFDRDDDNVKLKKRQISTLYNVFRPLTDLFISPIYSIEDDINIVSDNKLIKDSFENGDVLKQSKDLLLDYKLYDKCFFSVYTSIENKDSKIDLLSVNDNIQFPQINKINPEDVTDLNFNKNKQDTITYAKYYEYKEYNTTKIPVKVVYADNYFVMKTMAWRDKSGNITFDEQAEDSRIKEYDDEKYGVFNKIGNGLTDQPKSIELCDLQRELFNLNSEVRDLQRKCSHGIFTIYTDDEPESISLGNDSALILKKENAKSPEYIQADSDAIMFYENTIRDLKDHIYKIYTLSLWSENITYNSAMSSILASRSYMDAVNEYYNVYKNIIMKIIKDIIYIYGKRTETSVWDINFPELKTTQSDEDIDATIKGSIGIN